MSPASHDVGHGVPADRAERAAGGGEVDARAALRRRASDWRCASTSTRCARARSVAGGSPRGRASGPGAGGRHGPDAPARRPRRRGRPALRDHRSPGRARVDGPRAAARRSARSCWSSTSTRPSIASSSGAARSSTTSSPDRQVSTRFATCTTASSAVAVGPSRHHHDRAGVGRRRPHLRRARCRDRSVRVAPSGPPAQSAATYLSVPELPARGPTVSRRLTR